MKCRYQIFKKITRQAHKKAYTNYSLRPQNTKPSNTRIPARSTQVSPGMLAGAEGGNQNRVQDRTYGLRRGNNFLVTFLKICFLNYSIFFFLKLVRIQGAQKVSTFLDLAHNSVSVTEHQMLISRSAIVKDCKDVQIYCSGSFHVQ